MPLAEQIERLGATIRAELEAASDHHVHTKAAWRLIEDLADEGRQVRIENTDTGTVVDAAGLVALGQGYITGYLAESVFQHFVALFEDFLFGLLRCWLVAHPGGIPHKDRKPVALAAILEAADKDAIIVAVIDRELNELKYGRPTSWFRYLDDRVDLGCPSEDQVERFVEIKASRDVLVHNRGVVNQTYIDKAGPRARFAVGQRLEIRESYLRESWFLIGGLVAEMSAAAIVKAGHA